MDTIIPILAAATAPADPAPPTVHQGPTGPFTITTTDSRTPTAEPHDPRARLRIACVNVSGLRSHALYLKTLLEERGVDICLITETKLCDAVELRQIARDHGWTYLGCHRNRELDQNGKFADPQGGVAIINTRANSDLRIIPAGKLQHGLVAARVISNSGAFSPTLVVCVYCPPDGGGHDHLTARIAAHLDLLLSANGTSTNDRVIVAGDFNFQLGNKNPSGAPANRTTPSSCRKTSRCGTY